MIEKQREKEFLFELERLYHNYFLTIDLIVHPENGLGLILVEANLGGIDQTTERIEAAIDELRVDRRPCDSLETLEDMR